jgi:hypothetical protein
MMAAAGTAGAFIVGLLPVGLSFMAFRIRRKRQRWMLEHQTRLAGLTSVPDQRALDTIKAGLRSWWYRPARWQPWHEHIYRELFATAMESGVNEEERAWLDRVAQVLNVQDHISIRTEVLRSLLWELMADHYVSVEEEQQAEALLGSAGVPREALADELHVVDQLVRARSVKEEGPASINAGINLQKGEVCHHVTHGDLLERKVLRSYSRGGSRIKEEGLAISKTGDIYITSKRLLLVSDGVSSVPLGKVLDIEVDQDARTIEIIKDGRQKPIYLRVPDAVYTGILLDHLTSSAG